MQLVRQEKAARQKEVRVEAAHREGVIAFSVFAGEKIGEADVEVRRYAPPETPNAYDDWRVGAGVKPGELVAKVGDLAKELGLRGKFEFDESFDVCRGALEAIVEELRKEGVLWVCAFAPSQHMGDAVKKLGFTGRTDMQMKLSWIKRIGE